MAGRAGGRALSLFCEHRVSDRIMRHGFPQPDSVNDPPECLAEATDGLLMNPEQKKSSETIHPFYGRSSRTIHLSPACRPHCSREHRNSNNSNPLDADHDGKRHTIGGIPVGCVFFKRTGTSPLSLIILLHSTVQHIPGRHQGLLHGACQVMILAGRDDADIACLNRIFHAVNWKDTLSLEQNEHLILLMNMTRFGVGRFTGSENFHAAVVNSRPAEHIRHQLNTVAANVRNHKLLHRIFLFYKHPHETKARNVQSILADDKGKPSVSAWPLRVPPTALPEFMGAGQKPV